VNNNLQKKESAMLPQAKDDGTIYAFRSFMKIDSIINHVC